jgi:hypothetical protein
VKLAGSAARAPFVDADRVKWMTVHGPAFVACLSRVAFADDGAVPVAVIASEEDAAVVAHCAVCAEWTGLDEMCGARIL